MGWLFILFGCFVYTMSSIINIVYVVFIVYDVIIRFNICILNDIIIIIINNILPNP